MSLELSGFPRMDFEFYMTPFSAPDLNEPVRRFTFVLMGMSATPVTEIPRFSLGRVPLAAD